MLVMPSKTTNHEIRNSVLANLNMDWELKGESTFLSKNHQNYALQRFLFKENCILGLVTALSLACNLQTIVDIHYPADRSSRTRDRFRNFIMEEGVKVLLRTQNF